jgi:hypothetical protein
MKQHVIQAYLNMPSTWLKVSGFTRPIHAICMWYGWLLAGY